VTGGEEKKREGEEESLRGMREKNEGKKKTTGLAN
jgi:hypothetical protein